MCNSGVYKDSNGNTVYGTPIRISNIMLDVARTYPDKRIQLLFNDYSNEKIEELKKHIPGNERNFEIITTVKDGNNLLKFIGSQLKSNQNMHYFLLYDPYDASIDWSALRPFFNHWGEVLINHMISDSVRAIRQVKKEEKKEKYQNTYQVDDISELIPYGSDRTAYEKRLLEIIEHIKGQPDRKYYISSFPIFNSRNSLQYDLVHYTSNVKGFILFKSTAWKVFGGKSSNIPKDIDHMQLSFDFVCEDDTQTDNDKCYDVYDIAKYIQINFNGQKDVPLENIWSFVDEHPVFASVERNTIKSILKERYNTTISRGKLTFTDRSITNA